LPAAAAAAAIVMKPANISAFDGLIMVSRLPWRLQRFT
jgi:hypothetical protein